MPGVKIGKNTTIIRAIIDQNSIVGNSCRIALQAIKRRYFANKREQCYI